MLRAYTAVVATVLASATIQADVLLVREGKPMGRIAQLSKGPACANAAAELAKYIEAMTGARLPVAAQGERLAPGPATVFVATMQDAEPILDDAGLSAARDLKPGGFLVQVRSSGRAAPCVFVLGRDEAGLEFGVYHFLESLGCRWFLPGDLGEQVPRRATIGIADGLDVQNPDFVLRNVWWGYGGRPGWQKVAYATWRRRNKMGGVRAAMGHNLYRIITLKEHGEKFPQYFPLIDGRRFVPPTTVGNGWQPCTSNPAVVEIAAAKAIAAFDKDPNLFSYSLSPNDGYGWCECERCTAQDPPEFSGSKRRGKGRRMAIFANAVAERLAKKHPDKHVCWYAYAGAVEAPADVPVHPNVVISLAHYGWCGCNNHALNDPACKINPNFLKILDDWSAKTSKLFIREYWTTLVAPTDTLARVCAADSLAQDIPHFKAKGVIGFSSESTPDYGTCALNFWMAARKMWDAEADTAALLSDYYTGMYGPAADSMRGISESVIKQCRVRGCRGPYFSDDELQAVAARLEQAAALCATDKQRGRVALTQGAVAFSLQVRDYITAPSRAKKEAIQARLRAVEDSHNLSVDFKSVRARLKRGEGRADPALAKPYLGVKLEPLTAEPMPTAAAKAALTVRGQHLFVVLARAGDRVRGQIQVRRLGRYLTGAAFALVSPKGATVAKGQAYIGEAAEFDLTADATGAYVLVLDTGRNAARVYCDNQHFCHAGVEVRLLGRQPDAYVCLDPGAGKGRVTLTADGTGDPEHPGETAAMIVYAPGGEEIARGDTVSGKPVVAAIEPKPSQLRKPWSVRLIPAPKGIMEDLRLSLGPGMSEFVATHPSRLVATSR